MCQELFTEISANALRRIAAKCLEQVCVSLRQFRLVFFLTLVSSSSSLVHGAEAPHLPFTLAWIHGICKHCETAQTLEDLQFLGPDNAWGIGYRPPGETGAGDYVIVHSSNGGRTWTELPASYEHNASPHISFSNRQGWAEVFDVVNAETRVIQTADGGSHWRQLAPRDWFWYLRDIQSLGGGLGFAYSDGPDRTQGYLWGTRDNGRHWSKSALPAGFQADHMTFVNARQGFLAGCLNQRIAVARTSDGGLHWRTTPLDLPPAGAPLTNECLFHVDTLMLLDMQHAWLLLRKQFFHDPDEQGIIVVSRTTDGGATWKTAFQDSFPESRKTYGTVHFLSERVGFLSKRENIAGLQPTASLLYTTDGGDTWVPMEVARFVSSCRESSGSLTCASEDFWILKVSTHKQ